MTSIRDYLAPLRIGGSACVCLGIVCGAVGLAHADFQFLPAAPVVIQNAPPSATGDGTEKGRDHSESRQATPLVIEAPAQKPVPQSSLRSSVHEKEKSELTDSFVSEVKSDSVIAMPTSSTGNPVDGSSGVNAGVSGSLQSTPVVQKDVVLGFANDVPLNVALAQIVPGRYQWKIAPDVVSETVVSWRGGMDWWQVLQAALVPAGLTAINQGSGLEIKRAEMPVTSAVKASISEGVSSSDTMGKEGIQVAPSAPSPIPSQPSKSTDGGSTQLPPIALTPTPVSQSNQEVSAPREHVDRIAQDDGSKSRSMDAPPSAKATVDSLSEAAKKVDAEHADKSNEDKKTPELAIEQWTVPRGAHVHSVLEEWCQRSGVELNWLAEYDYPVQASVSFTGTFEDAVRGLLAGLRDAQPQPVASLHNNANTSNRVLVVWARGNNYSE